MEKLSEIYAHLLANPDYGYITPDGTRLYVIINQTTLMYFSGRDFNSMSAEEVNKYIQDYRTEN